MSKRAPRRRPGGRSARVRADVYRAVAEILAEGSRTELTMANIAARSGVHQATIYRRWPSVEALALEAAMARLKEESPMPDTGTLRGDLMRYATRVAASLVEPGGRLLLRAVMATAEPDGQPSPLAVQILLERASQTQAMLDRARDRGERALGYLDVLDDLLAPMYLRAIFGLGRVSPAFLRARIDRLLA